MSVKIFFFIKKIALRKLSIRPIILVSFWMLVNFQVSYGQYSCGTHKVYVCHKGKNTLCVDESAVQAHLDHGDHLGQCNSNLCGVSVTAGRLTCIDTIATLVAISNTSSVTYSWSGPNSFTSSLYSPSTNIPGTYTVTVTDTIYACTASGSVSVIQDTLAPGATVDGGDITCKKPLVALSGNSETSGVSFKWTGPKNYASTKQNTVTTVAGEYILLVTNPKNGCISVDTKSIYENRTSPEDVTAIVNDMLTCTNTSITLTGLSGTSGVIYNWTGPHGFSSMEQSPIVTNPGNYKLKVTNPVSGCKSSASVLVEQDITHPSGVVAMVSGIISCADTIVTLTGSSSSSGVNYSWIDPNNLNFVGNSASVSIPGTYILTVINTANGCSESANVTIEKDIEAPASLIASVNDTLSSTVPSVLLSATSATDEVIYDWTGPKDFISNEQNAGTNLPGIYTVMATNPKNGCSSIASVTVVKDVSVE